MPDITVNMPLMTVEFLIDENLAHFERRVQTLADVFSMTGGLMGITIAIV